MGENIFCACMRAKIHQWHQDNNEANAVSDEDSTLNPWKQSCKDGVESDANDDHGI